LVLDDFCLTALDAADTALVYEVIVERHRRVATVTTSNREPMKAHRFGSTCARSRLTLTGSGGRRPGCGSRIER